MKRSGCKTVIGLFVLSAIFLLSGTALAQELDKKYNKEYSVQGNELLKINNRYGDVIVEGWNENRVVIDVTVTLEHPSKEKAEKLLSMIEVIFSENDNTIEARTEIDSKFSFNGWGENKKFSIDYDVKLPVGLDFDVANAYGGVRIDELSGHVNIVVKYGSLFAEKLSRGNTKPLNAVTLAYGNGEIVETGWAELNLRYIGKMKVGSAQALLVNSRYSKLEIEDVSSIVLDSKYDHISLGNLNNIVAESGYTGFNIGNVEKKVDIEAGYGSITIDNVSAGFEDVQIVANYCHVKIGVDEDAGYKMNLKTHYGGLSFNEDNAEIINRIYENNSKSVEAVVGDKGSSSQISVTTKYGSVKVF
ncbi:MAG TPA: hypothetical protein VMW76_05335 [Bacteroidales bacterium]|nr:hypothetical protein [Bacteroidales bacterium]